MPINVRGEYTSSMHIHAHCMIYEDFYKVFVLDKCLMIQCFLNQSKYVCQQMSNALTRAHNKILVQEREGVLMR